MPNWITNRLTIKADNETLERIINEVKTDKQSLDFEKIIPMPENIFRGNLGTEERKLYGRNNWYDWSCDNWGTKWNACNNEYDAEIFNGTLVYDFETAWSAPYPIVQKISEKYKCACVLEYYDEDFGYNCGRYECTSGTVVKDVCFNGGDEALEWIAETFGSDTMDSFGCELKDGKWQYRED